MPNNMRFLLPLLFIASVTHAEITAGAEYVSAYVFRGDRIADASLQPTVNLTFGSAYGTIWGSRSLHRDQLNETDFTIGYTNETLHLDTGITAYTYEGLESSYEPFIGFSGGPASLYAYYDWVLRTWAFEGKLTHTKELTEKLSIDLNVTVGNVDGHYSYWSLGILPKYQITEKFSVSVGLSYRSASSADHSRDVWVYTAGVSCTF